MNFQTTAFWHEQTTTMQLFTCICECLIPLTARWLLLFACYFFMLWLTTVYSFLSYSNTCFCWHLMWEEWLCISTLIDVMLTCNLSCVQTRCCNPQSACLPAGTSGHCAYMDSWSRWCSLLLHLTPGHQDTCSLMCTVTLSTSSQSEGTEGGDKPNRLNKHLFRFCAYMCSSVYIHMEACPDYYSSCDTQSQWSQAAQWSSPSKS